MTARSRNSNAHLAGLKAQLDVRDERMRLADERREEVQKTAERLTGQVDVLTAQLQQHAAPAEIERTAGIIQSTTTVSRCCRCWACGAASHHRGPSPPCHIDLFHFFMRLGIFAHKIIHSQSQGLFDLLAWESRDHSRQSPRQGGCGIVSCSAGCACWGGGLSRGLVSCGNRRNLLHLASGGLTYFSVGGIRLFGSGWRGCLQTHPAKQ